MYIISDLIGNSCYLFGVRGYTVNGYGLRTVIGIQKLAECEGPCFLITCLRYLLNLIFVN